MDENKKQTVLAFVRLACTLVTTGLAMYGITVDANAIFVGAMLVLALIAYVWSWWKNNNVSTAATEAQKVLDELKNGVGVEIIDDDFGNK